MKQAKKQTESHFELDENGDNSIVTEQQTVSSNSVEKWEMRIQPSDDGLITTINCGTNRIAEVCHNGNINEHYNNANLICEAVNNYQSLKDSNRDLIEALGSVLTEISPAYNFDFSKAPESIKKAYALYNTL